MSLFKSNEERQLERDVRIRQGLREIERAIRDQEKFAEQYIRQAQACRSAGDEAQYRFVRSALKKTTLMKRVLERQLLSLRNAMLLKKQAETSAAFARNMGTLASDMGQLLGSMDLARTQAQWQQAMAQSRSVEEKMDVFLDAIQQTAEADVADRESLVSDEEIDRLIEAEAAVAHEQELSDLAGLRARIERLKSANADG